MWFNADLRFTPCEAGMDGKVVQMRPCHAGIDAQVVTPPIGVCNTGIDGVKR